MFCQQCGHQAAEGAKFCANCGGSLVNDHREETSSQAPQAAASSTPERPGGGKKKDLVDCDYYELLGVGRDADAGTIADAIKKKRNLFSSRASKPGEQGSRAQFIVKRIGEAEQVLLDAEARKRYDESLKEPAAAPLVRHGERDWVNLSYQYLNEGDLEMAQEACEEAVSQQSENPDAWFVSIDVYLARGKYDDADKAARRLLLLENDNPYAYGVRADLLCDFKNDFDQAKVFYGKMKECALSRGLQDLAKQADEKIVICDAMQINLQYCEPLSKKYNALGINSVSSYDTEIAKKVESIRSEARSVETKLEKVLNTIKDPSQFFCDQKKRLMQPIEEVLEKINSYLDERDKKVNQIRIIAAICFFVVLVAILINPIIGLLAFCLVGWIASKFGIISALELLGAGGNALGVLGIIVLIVVLWFRFTAGIN